VAEGWPIHSRAGEEKMHDKIDGKSQALTLRPNEARIIFAAMIKADMEAGLLRYSKRRRLIRYAAKMGIPEIEAQLIMAQVRTGTDSQQPVRPLTSDEIGDALKQARQYNLTMRKILIATAAAVAVNLLTINWLFY
jgi:hypothetical protein